MQAADEYRKAVDNQIAMIEEVLSRIAAGMRTWQQIEGTDEWRDTTEESMQRLATSLGYFKVERDTLSKQKRKK